MSKEEFEDIFGNVPFENIKKIQKYIEDNYVSLDLYNKLKENNVDITYKYIMLCNAVEISYGEEELEELKKLVNIAIGEELITNE